MIVPDDFAVVFARLKPVLGEHARHFSVQVDKPAEYTLETKRPSPFTQHKGHGLFFGSVRQGKAYVSFHLMPIYMNPELAKLITPALRERMQGKSCFNFKTVPDAQAIKDLEALTAAAFTDWNRRNWI